jgi:hypothetical protein
MDSTLILPDHAADEHQRAVEHDVAIAHAFGRLLRELDPQLTLFWVKSDSTSFENPGRWHIGRLHSNPELNTYWVIQNEDGSYCEPQERHLERLRAMDSHSRNVMEDMRRRRKLRHQAARQRFDERRAMFRELLEERLAHIYGSSIRVPRAIAEPTPEQIAAVAPDTPSEPSIAIDVTAIDKAAPPTLPRKLVLPRGSQPKKGRA